MNSQMTPHMAQAAPSAGQMLAQMSRQNGVTHSVTPSHPAPPASTVAPLQGVSAGGGWPASGAAARPQFNNQVTICHEANQPTACCHSTVWFTFLPVHKTTQSRAANIHQKFNSSSEKLSIIFTNVFYHYYL